MAYPATHALPVALHGTKRRAWTSSLQAAVPLAQTAPASQRAPLLTVSEITKSLARLETASQKSIILISSSFHQSILLNADGTPRGRMQVDKSSSKGSKGPTARQRVAMELLQTETNYVTILQTILQVRRSNQRVVHTSPMHEYSFKIHFETEAPPPLSLVWLSASMLMAILMHLSEAIQRAVGARPHHSCRECQEHLWQFTRHPATSHQDQGLYFTTELPTFRYCTC